MPTDNAPPAVIPQHLINDFTMNGSIPVIPCYLDNRRSTPIHNSAHDYHNAFAQFEEKTFRYYDGEIDEFYDALDDFSLQGKKVLVWGLAGLNCEALAVWKGADAVYVVDYNKVVCEHERIHSITHDDLKNLSIPFDYAFSFSSFEHDGLGRYGDPISPYADIKTMQYAKSKLADDGVLFLGVPMGKDALAWNAHRIYGKKRLPLLLHGWLPVGAYSIYTDVFNMPLGAAPQPLIALRKTKGSQITQEEFLEAMRHARAIVKHPHPGTRDAKLLVRILEMLRPTS